MSRQGRTNSSLVLAWETQKMGCESLGLNQFLPEVAGGVAKQKPRKGEGGQKRVVGTNPPAEGPERASQAKNSFHNLPCSSSLLYNLFILPNRTALCPVSLRNFTFSVMFTRIAFSSPSTFFLA